MAGLSRREQSSTSRTRFPYHHAVWTQQPSLHPSPCGRLAFHGGFRAHLQQIQKLHGPPACKTSVGHVIVTVSCSSPFPASFMCWCVLHCFPTQPRGADPSSLFPAEGAVALGLACAPQHLHLSYRGRELKSLMQQLLNKKKKIAAGPFLPLLCYRSNLVE